ncbi:Rap30/74 interaction domain-containing protein [Myriangium duriaei CBS 260.36]|uniref:Transcription initiation factor IIF subunit alpha n=1 Tax=Myriangium duriaei CBS 260.36 TaxID=1168546 RepID=A0A9P4MN21_9PEZI|nr:Rap30/74 interaction domain-containing protein [Myriangium duriaei CBS 260.36]
MSASPAGGAPSGPASTTPNASTAGAVQRRRPQSNPFVVKKKPVKKAPEATNGAAKPAPKPTTTAAPKPATQAQAPDPDDDPSTYTAYPLVASKKAILQGFRYHAMRLISEQEANPYDETQFTRPLRLHRRFARDQRLEPVALENGVDDKEREKEEIRKAERQAQKEANQAQIAPTEKPNQKKKLPQFKKKVEDVFYPQDTPEAQKRAKLRYEEGRPWHLEDFDGKNTWIGTYEEPLSETHAMLVLDGNGNFRMVPLEKWYRFIPTNRYKTMNLDEAEKHMAKKIKGSRWLAENTMTEDQRQKLAIEQQRRAQGRARVGMRGERSGGHRDDDDEVPEAVHDADEIDYNAEDEFQDDDEGGLFLGDEEDVKESERKIRKEMLEANIFAGNIKEEKDWDAEEEAEKKKEREERKKQKKLRRALVKNERKFEYESESDNPWTEDDETSSDDDLFKDPDIKKEDEKTASVNGEKLVSGASSVGTNTPSGRTEKHGDPLRASQLAGSSLKRPGSPNLSEASGSESSRKRIKKEANGQLSRPMSPSIPGGKGPMSPSSLNRRRGAGSGSDTEASGTERSRPKIRITSSRDASPGGSTPVSRAGSPPPRSAGAATPTSAGGLAAVPPGFPSADEVRAAIPPNGISITDLIRRFRGQIPRTTEANAAFITLVKKVGRNAPNDRKLIVQK